MKITAVLLKLGQTRVIISPMSPKITEKREKREREREREKKRLAAVFSFYSVTKSDLVFINPGIYLHSMATVIGKSAKNQFPAYVGQLWSMSQRLLEMICIFKPFV